MPAKQTRKGRRGTSRAAGSKAPESAYRFTPAELERALRTGEHVGLLEDYFGDAAYRELRQLAQEAATRGVRGGPRVLILPGIMGSTLAKPGLIFDDTIWVEPVSIARGKLFDLILNGGHSKVFAAGALLPVYLKLKLKLGIAGFDADYYPFDWRRGIDSLGQGLARGLAKDNREVSLVAHSMGGLVSRAAIASGAKKVKRLIMLGTPNFGSFAPVQALRAVYPLVRQVAVADLKHTPEQLAEKVFATFPGLYQMLPWPAKWSALNLYDLANWPAQGPRPRQKLLDGVARVQQLLAQAQGPYFLIAGVNQETITSVRRSDGEFLYETSLDGDGTVPLSFAELPGTKTYYVEESHGSLPNNGAVERAVVDLLNRGETQELPDRRPATERGGTRQIGDAELRAASGEGRVLSQREFRHLLEEWASPVAREAGPAIAPRGPVAAAATAAGAESDTLIIGRPRQRRLDVQLAQGSITEVNTRAIVLGIFQGVAPSGAAAALDQRLDGAIAEFTRRRMFSGSVGEVFLMPVGRYSLRADLICFVGLGPFDRFGDEVQKMVGEHVIRTLVRTDVEDLATVVPGGGSGWSPAAALRNLFAGFLRGLSDADKHHKFRSVTLCEIDQVRCEEIRGELHRLFRSTLLDDVEVTFRTAAPLPSPVAPAVRAAGPAAPQPAYLIVRQETAPGGKKTPAQLAFRASLLGVGAKATVVTREQTVSAVELNQHLKLLESEGFDFAALEDFGPKLAQLTLHDEVLTVLPKSQKSHLVVVTDAPSSRIPWETIRLDGWAPAAAAGLSRKYLADNLSVAKWLDERQQDAVLDVLLVVDPTQDLPGAAAEGERIEKMFASHPGVKVHPIRQAAATRTALLEAFRSGRYDVIHYAGHAFFDPDDPGRSGILCHGKVPLSGADLAGLSNLPSLVVFNACEAARVRGRRQARKDLQKSIGLAEAFLRGGVANYVGTYWPVGDAAAEVFAGKFYEALLAGRPIAEALCTARQELRGKQNLDWADYIHYGAHDFVLKQR